MSQETNGFSNMPIEEQLKTIIEQMDIFAGGASENELTSLLTKMTEKLMDNGVSAMKDLLKKNSTFNMGDKDKVSDTLNMNGLLSILGGNIFKRTGSGASQGGEGNVSITTTPEIKALFEEWSRQIQEEIENYKKENKDATKNDLSQFLKLSEESLKFFIKDPPGDDQPQEKAE